MTSVGSIFATSAGAALLMLALAIGAKTLKMHQGRHGANHPVQAFTTGKVEIVSMNHGSQSIRQVRV